MTARDDLLRRLAWLDSTVLSDALDALGLPAGVGGVPPQWGAPRVVGVARTVEVEPDAGGAPGPHIMTRVVEAADAGDVVVVANGGRTDVSCWGGILSLASVARGVVGAVVDGACRDVAEAQACGFPVFARATTPRTARGRLREKAVGTTVDIAGVAVSDGDLVVADGSGLVAIPRSHAQAVLDRAEAVVAREAAIAADVRAGANLPDAMHDARLAGQTPAGGSAGTVRVPARDQLAALPTAAVSDAMDRLGLAGGLHGISALREGQRACGPAYTAAYEPVDALGGTVGDFLDDVEPGAVVVIDNGGRTDCTVWGGIMTRVAAAAGIAGTVVYGACRDTEVSAEVGYPIWSAGRFMRTGKNRVRLAAVGRPVSVDGVTISPGDVICADTDGVVVVPTAHASEVARIANGVDATERRILAAVQGGARLTAARAAHGYHVLQQPDAPTQADA